MKSMKNNWGIFNDNEQLIFEYRPLIERFLIKNTKNIK